MSLLQFRRHSALSVIFVVFGASTSLCRYPALASILGCLTALLLPFTMGSSNSQCCCNCTSQSAPIIGLCSNRISLSCQNLDAMCGFDLCRLQQGFAFCRHVPLHDDPFDPIGHHAAGGRGSLSGGQAHELPHHPHSYPLSHANAGSSCVPSMDGLASRLDHPPGQC